MAYNSFLSDTWDTFGSDASFNDAFGKAFGKPKTKKKQNINVSGERQPRRGRSAAVKPSKKMLDKHNRSKQVKRRPTRARKQVPAEEVGMGFKAPVSKQLLQRQRRQLMMMDTPVTSTLPKIATKGKSSKKPKTYSHRGPTVAMLRKEAKAYNREIMIGGHVKGGISKMKKAALIKALQDA